VHGCQGQNCNGRMRVKHIRQRRGSPRPWQTREIASGSSAL
jgi:hypothetical protein